MNSKKFLNEIYYDAYTILGRDFVSPEEVMHEALPGLFYSNEQLKNLAILKPKKEVLEWCYKNEYAVAPAPPTPTSFVEIQHEFLSVSFEKALPVECECLQNEKTTFGWLLIKKHSVEGSIGRHLDKQDKLLSALEEIPKLVEISWFVLVYYKMTGLHLFKDTVMRTSSMMMNNMHIGFKNHELSLIVGAYSSFYQNHLGLSAIRRYE